MNHFFAEEQDLKNWAQEWAKKISSPYVIFLSGELGSGKTTFCRAFIQGFGIKEMIKSPTYSLIEEYKIDEEKKIVHVDLYRIQDPEEINYLGLEHYFNTIMLIEWPERAIEFLPKASLHLQFSHHKKGRLVEII